MYLDVKKLWGCEQAAQMEAGRLRLVRIRREKLRAMKHMHKFGDDLRCTCGLLERDYFCDRPDEVCPDWEGPE